MPREDEVDKVGEWEERCCDSCGLPFPRRSSYGRRCLICYKTEKDYKVLWGDQAFLWAQLELARTRSLNARLVDLATELKEQRPSTGGLDPKTVNDLIFLCHPDKHKDSTKATEATKALLALRRQLKRGEK
jgi:hypothetical protein